MKTSTRARVPNTQSVTMAASILSLHGNTTFGRARILAVIDIFDNVAVHGSRTVFFLSDLIFVSMAERCELTGLLSFWQNFFLFFICEPSLHTKDVRSMFDQFGMAAIKLHAIFLALSERTMRRSLERTNY